MVKENIKIENARIIFRNFSGKPGKYNNEGDRNFCVLLDEASATDLLQEGWNVKYLQPKDPEDDPQAYLQVAVRYSNIPPKIWVVTAKQKTLLDEDSVSMLDWAELANVDLIIRPYNYNVRGQEGVKAYVKTMYCTIYEDEFADKYEDVPDSARSATVG